MTTIKILSQTEISEFDNPPNFSDEEREYYFRLPKWATRVVNDLRLSSNKIGFVLLLGYFRACKRFFSHLKFQANDMVYVAQRYNLELRSFDFESYDVKSDYLKRNEILHHLGFKRFNTSLQEQIVDEIGQLINRQLNLRTMFSELIGSLEQSRTEIPSYNTLSKLITRAFNRHEKRLLGRLRHSLTAKHKRLIEQLLEIDESYQSDDKQDLKIKRYRLTLLKKIKESTRPAKIRENVVDFKVLQNLYKELETVMSSLDLPSEAVKHYAKAVGKAQVFQIARRKGLKKHLYLICFITHQYYTLHDTLIDIFLSATKTTLNTCLREYKEKTFEEYKGHRRLIKEVREALSESQLLLFLIENITTTSDLSSDDKISMIQTTLSKNNPEHKKMWAENIQDKSSDGNAYNEILQTRSRKLQQRVSEIIKWANFSAETSNPDIMDAINYYQQKNGNLGKDAPLDFLLPEEQKAVFNDNGQFQVSLYKVFLYSHLASAIKSGKLNLNDSYKYRSFDEYLIPKEDWNRHKKEYLKKAKLEKFADVDQFLKHARKKLNNQYNMTNTNITLKKNEHIKFNKNGSFVLSTPKVDKEVLGSISELFPQDKYIPLSEVLSSVNKTCGFLEAFQHHQIKYHKERPQDKAFIAGLINYGCNIGTDKMAKISHHIKESELDNAVSWYFSLDNLESANNHILRLINKLELPNVYKNDKHRTHTASDGQKYTSAKESMNTNYSYKYYGQAKGGVSHGFIDDRCLFFHTTMISSADREAHYVIDGLMHNEVVQSDIHSTDTHGYSEVIFGITSLLGLQFAPRIKNLKKQKLYGFKKIKSYKRKGYKILPSRYVNEKVIRDNWDDILRFIATIKLKKATASQLLRRLNSYSKHHPLYRALKALGRIEKSILILKYIDDVRLRQYIQKALNKMEGSNRLAKAVHFGSNQQIIYQSKNEQDIADLCKRIIQNAIVCWNYLYLSKLILNAESVENRLSLIEIIRNGSIITWKHLNLHGEYDFSNEKLQDIFGLDDPALLNLNVA
jgi:TnpA family transposase